jgi:hypothetical protein
MCGGCGVLPTTIYAMIYWRVLAELQTNKKYKPTIWERLREVGPNVNWNLKPGKLQTAN